MQTSRTAPPWKLLATHFLVGLLLTASAVAAADWPQYRGPTHDGVSTERINKNWTGSTTNALWRVFLGNGLTGLTASGGRVLTQVHRDVNGVDMEVCLALDADTGAELWATPVDDIVIYDGGVGTTDDGPRTTPAIDAGSVYVLTSYLKLLRLDATNGSVIWSNDLRLTYGGDIIGWQNAASPLLDNGLIYLNVNAASANLMALRTSDGGLVWRSQDEFMTHATPVFATMYGVRQLIFATQSGLVSVDPQTGSRLWQTNYPFVYDISVGASPAVFSNYVFVTADYLMGSAAFQILQTNSTFTPRLLWSNSGLHSHWMTPVCAQGCLFGQFTPDSADAQLRCLDLRTGAQKWAANGFGRGSVLIVDDRLLVITERGFLVLANLNTNAYSEIARFRAIPDFHPDTNKCWNAPAFSNGRVYVRSTAYAAAFDLSLPDLKLDTPQSAPASKLNLTIRTVTGTPVDSNRLTSMEVRASTNAALFASSWTKLTNALVFSNGVVRVTNVDASPPRRFFIVSEPK